jgi:hypothetical protein
MNHPLKNQSEYSDSKYLLILFTLISIVLFFVFLIYFIYWQKQFIQKTTSGETQNIEELRRTNNLTAKNTIPTVTVPTINPNVDISRYNPRDPDTLRLSGKLLLERYFSAIKSGEYRLACSLLSNTICNAKRDIFSFSQFLGKINGGYQVKTISLANEQKPTEAIYCIEYTYTLKSDLNPQPVTEFFQYRIKTRPDGAEEISARVCEKIVKDGRERPCPIITPKKYCF